MASIFSEKIGKEFLKKKKKGKKKKEEEKLEINNKDQIKINNQQFKNCSIFNDNLIIVQNIQKNDENTEISTKDTDEVSNFWVDEEKVKRNKRKKMKKKLKAKEKKESKRAKELVEIHQNSEDENEKMLKII